MTRDYYFDNVKGALITLVVIGHFLMPMDKTRLTDSLINVIYLFHMPMFALTTGYFAKHVYENGRYRTDRIFRLIWFYILFKLCAHVTENLAAGTPITGNIDFFRESGAPWYLLAMIWWNLSVPCQAELKPKTVLALSIAAGLLSGYQDSVGSVLAVSRTLTFAPFFYWGYYWNSSQVREFRSSRRRFLFFAAACFMGAAVILGNDHVQEINVIVYGMNYSRMAPAFYQWGAVIRLGCYVGAAVMILGLMAVIPKKKMFWTFLGQRTLQIYIIHRLLRDMMEYGGFYETVTSRYRVNVALVVVLAGAVTFVLGNSWFAQGFKQLQKVPDKLYNSWKQDP